MLIVYIAVTGVAHDIERCTGYEYIVCKLFI
jgi:hypothetical protein